MAERRYKLIGQGLVGNSGFSVGDLSTGEVLYFDGSKWQNTDAVTVDPDGAVELYYDGTNVVSTTERGLGISSNVNHAEIFFTDSDGQTAFIHKNNTGPLLFRNLEHGGAMFFEAEDAGGVLRSMIRADPDGSVDLYHAGAKALETTRDGDTSDVGGILISDPKAEDKVGIILKSGTTGASGGFLITHWSDGDTYIDNRRTSGRIRIRAANSGGASQNTMILADPDGSTSLYYDGTEVFSTASNGITVAVPNDFWAGGPNIFNPWGYFGSHGSFGQSISWNGYRNNSGSWTSLGVNGSNNAGLIWITDASGISFHYNNSWPTGSSVTPTQQMRIDPAGGLVVGSPTGGAKGLGSINAQNIYDDNSPVSDYVFDAELDGEIDLDKWDRAVPNRRHLEEDADGNVISEEVEVRNHEPARRFAQRTDDLDPEAYAAKWRARRKLPAFDDGDEPVQLSLGEYSQRLLETCEVQAVHIDKLRLRIDELEERLDGQDTTTDR